jgi:sulfatase maturation enzyme AslB (radical SAM superfamily)
MLTPNFTLNSKIYLTFRCNCSCSYCAEKYFGVATTSDMTEKTLIEIISTLLRTTRSITNNVTIGFTGG